MQRPGRSEPLTPLGGWILAAGITLMVIYALHDSAGGLRAVWHRRIRWPFMTTVALLAIGSLGAWLLHLHRTGRATERHAALGGLLLVFGVIATPVAVMVTTSRLRSRQLDGLRITTELEGLPGSDSIRPQADGTNAHRTLELLDELSQLIGPGHHAPGQPWATHAWIAERLRGTGALKPGSLAARRNFPGT